MIVSRNTLGVELSFNTNSVECHMAINIFCIVCKKWLCDPQLVANCSDNDQIATNNPRYITISFDDGKMT
jgi:hypothetical protein